MTRIHVGCCGLAGLGLRRYAGIFSCVELQSTFYRLPQEKTAMRWRAETPSSFQFCVKAFQGVTHPIGSPTWRRAGPQRPTEGAERYGLLQPTDEVFRCWESTMNICRILRASACVVQLPPSFRKSAESQRDLREFFGRAERPVPTGVELRHPSWFEDRGELARELGELGLACIVDPFSEEPIATGRWAYFRLHGRKPLGLRYKYTGEDLRELFDKVLGLGVEEAFVMFNNLEMRDDARRFQELVLAEGG